MRISKNLPANWEELGALRSLIPSGLLQGGTENLEEDQGKPGKWKRPPQTTETIKRRFLSKVKKDPVSGCWNWQDHLMDNGYGTFYCVVKKILAHRIAWLLYRGEIAEEMCVLHKCDNRRCVNPEHLFIGTNQDNQDDCKAKGRRRHPIGTDLSTSKLTEAQVLDIKRRLSIGESCKSIASDYPSVTENNISCIKRGRSWAWLKL